MVGTLIEYGGTKGWASGRTGFGQPAGGAITRIVPSPIAPRLCFSAL
jgi:hypothetical protein